jgi:nitrate/nitrite transport system substrate-binding protein
VRALVDRTNRSDLWIEAAKTLGLTGYPTGDSRGPERFFDGKEFDPSDIQAIPQIALHQARCRV